MDDYELIDNTENHQYEFHIGKLVPKIEYIKSKNGEIYLTHTHGSSCPTGRKGCRQSTGRKSTERYRKTGITTGSTMPLCSRIH